MYCLLVYVLIWKSFCYFVVIMAKEKGEIDINLASADDFALLPGIGKNKAQAVIECRENLGGHFSSIDDISSVPGISKTLFDSIRPRLICKVASNELDTEEEMIDNRMLLRSGEMLQVTMKQVLKRKLSAKSDSEVSHSSSGVLCEKRPKYNVCDSLDIKSPRSPPTKLLSGYYGYPTPSCAMPGDTVRRRLPSCMTVPPANLDTWLQIFRDWTNEERTSALNALVDVCDMSLVRHLMAKIEPQFQRDFISLLPKELALYVLSFLEPKDLCKAAQTCRYWRILAEDNL